MFVQHGCQKGGCITSNEDSPACGHGVSLGLASVITKAY